jgi:hypothetical protein
MALLFTSRSARFEWPGRCPKVCLFGHRAAVRVPREYRQFGFGATQGAGTVTLSSLSGQVISWNDTQVVALFASGARSGLVRIQQGTSASNAVSFKAPDGTGMTMTLSPEVMNVRVGETRTIRAVNQAGHQ